MRLAPLAFGLLLTTTAGHAATPITLDQAMADPDWIGPPVERPYWSVDGRSVHYWLKRAGSPVRDLHRVDIDGGKDAIVEVVSAAISAVVNVCRIGMAPSHRTGRDARLGRWHQTSIGIWLARC